MRIIILLIGFVMAVFPAKAIDLTSRPDIEPDYIMDGKKGVLITVEVELSADDVGKAYGINPVLGDIKSGGASYYPDYTTSFSVKSPGKQTYKIFIPYKKLKKATYRLRVSSRMANSRYGRDLRWMENGVSVSYSHPFFLDPKSKTGNAKPFPDEPKPQPKPNPVPTPKPVVKNAPVLTWINCPATTDSPVLKLKIGVKTSSPVKEYKVLLNGSATRGIKAVINDGYDLVIDQTLTLAEGANEIKVVASNTSGEVVDSRSVVYQKASEPKPQPKPAVVKEALKKVALVVGNADYHDQPLRNTVNDAKAMAAELRTLGFDVISLNNASKRQLESAINDLGNRARNYDVAMFYYAGHGIQYKGDNYLVPVNAELNSESDVEYECTNVNRVLSKLEESGVKMKVIALDACRNNPFERSWHRGAGTGRGLSAINAPVGTFISYATSPGTVAADGTGNHSPYTTALLETLKEKDLPIEKVFKQVAAKVFNRTGKSQSPWYASSLFEGEFVFNPSK